MNHLHRAASESDSIESFADLYLQRLQTIIRSLDFSKLSAFEEELESARIAGYTVF